MSLKRFVKVIPVILAISITCNVSTASVSAASLTTQSKSNAIIYKSAHDVYTEKSVLQNIDKQITPGYIYVDGVKNALYRVFDNQGKALNNIKMKIPELLIILAKQYSLSELSDRNWKDYQTSLNSYTTKNEKLNNDISLLRCFFDIYENKDDNQKILNLIGAENQSLNMKTSISDSSTSQLSDEKTNELSTLMPYTSPIARDFNSNIMKQSNIGQKFNSLLGSTVLGFNTDKGIAYAEKYAVNANSSEYGCLGADCTNFVSQILEAGGVQQAVYSDKNSGWWHTKGWFGWQSYSRSWTLADTFCRYMGVGYESGNIYNFSYEIAAGDFIALDDQGDGSWDHCGFVVKSDNFNAVYSGKRYYDFKVAQHTNNYCEWTSNSTNHWESVEDDGGVYARVRR